MRPFNSAVITRRVLLGRRVRFLPSKTRVVLANESEESPISALLPGEAFTLRINGRVVIGSVPG